ncbi:MAG: hypothetical protein RRY64_05120 [Oscillospiraceae bacterium]
MKKSLLAIGLSLTMVLAMATPAFAATTDTNLNPDGTAVTAPGTPGVVQTAGESYNAASITNKAGVNTPTANDWEVVNDDDAIAKASDIGADINVWAKVVDSGSKIYKVDLAWGAMKFEYKDSSGQWNTTTHKYEAAADTGKGWTEAAYLDGINNKVAITNHSNNAIDAAFAYAMNGTKFNDANGLNNVIGNFFDANATAVTAAKVLTGTYSDTAGTVAPTAVAGKLAGPVVLATAEAYNDGTAHVAGERIDEVFFAFSGTPDTGKGKVLDTFKKVGVITVTVTPNNTPNLNAAP